jgi:uncharacterized membrane protein
MMMIGFGFLVLLLLGGLVVALLVGGGTLLNQKGTIGSLGGKDKLTGRQVLDERLARGEISPEEYEEIRARIGE